MKRFIWIYTKIWKIRKKIRKTVVFANWNISRIYCIKKKVIFAKSQKTLVFPRKNFYLWKRSNVHVKSTKFVWFRGIIIWSFYVNDATSPTWRGISLARGFPQETSGPTLHGSPASPPRASASGPTSWPSFFSAGSRRPPPGAQSNGPFPWGQGCGSGLDPDSIGSVDTDPDSESGSGSRRAIMTQKKN